MQTIHTAQKGGFAATGGADQRYDLLFRYLQVDAFQHFLSSKRQVDVFRF
jgi:hypothetical protein